jgi:hypothetical protein
MLSLGILPISPRDPFDGVVVLSRLQAQQAHQLQAVDVKRVYRKGLLAAQLRIEMAAGLHVAEAEFMERSGGPAVVSFNSLIGPAGGGPAFTTIHIDYSYRRISTA